MKLYEVATAAVAIGSETSVHTWSVVVAGVFVLFSLSLSTFLLFEHLSTYNDPEVCPFLLFDVFDVFVAQALSAGAPCFVTRKMFLLVPGFLTRDWCCHRSRNGSLASFSWSLSME